MNAQDLALALVRTTLANTAACGLAWLLLTKLRIDSPRVHRLAWTLAILQGWLLFPWTLEIAAPATPVSRDAVAERVHSPTPAPSFTVVNQISLQTRRSHPLLDSPLLAAVPIAAWLAGAIALAAAGVCGFARVLRSLPLGSPPDDPAWRTEWRRQLNATHIPARRRVDLRMTTDLGPLLYWTPWTYLVLVPKALWAALTSPERQSILRHELAHLQRGDLWKSLAIRVLALPQWFNPLARLAVRRFDEAGEWACDDAAAGAAAGGPIAFANSLLHAAEFASADLPGSLAANGGVLSRRIHRLVTPRFKEESKMKKYVLPSLLAALAAVQLVRVEAVAATKEDAGAGASVVKQADPEQRRLWNDDEYLHASTRPYVIEPPDVLKIEVKGNPAFKEERKDQKTPRQVLEGTEPIECLVQMDGRITLGVFGEVYVAGLTVDESLRAVSAHLSKTLVNPQVSLEVHRYNSKVVYVIAEDPSKGDDVTRLPLPYPLTAEENVGKVVATVFNPDDERDIRSNLASRTVTVRRPAVNGVGKERSFAVKWDAMAGQPTPETNIPLLPGDRIFVTAPGKRSSAAKRTPISPSVETILPPPRYDAYVYPTTAPAAPQADPPATPGDRSVDFKIAILEDANDHLSEFESLRDGFMLDETGTMRDALRVLEKQGLITCVARPQLMTPLGVTGKMRVGAAATNKDWGFQNALAIEVCTREVGDHLSVEIKMNRRDGDVNASVDTRVDVKSEQTVILNASGPLTKSKGKLVKRQTYLVLTPTLVK